MPKVRQAESVDASRLAEILIFAKRTAYRSIFCNDYVSFHEMQVLDLALDYQRDTDALCDVYVYEEDGIVKGMMHWGRPEQPSDHWQLHELYVDPFFQKQGVGRALMDAFLTSATQAGATDASLWVLEPNLSARRFYEAAGFRADGERKLQPGTDVTLLRYQRGLQDPLCR